MVQVVYGDVLLLIDFCMNFFILHTTGVFLRRRSKAACLICASLVGGIYSVAKLFVNGNNVIDCVISFAVGLLMCYIAYGGYKFVKTALVFFGASALVGGAMFGVYFLLGSYHSDLIGNVRGYAYSHIPLWLFVVLAAVSFFLSWIFSYSGREATEKSEITATVKNGGASMQLRILLDSGNLVKEPISGKYVILIGLQKAKLLFSADVCTALEKKNDEFLLKNRFRIICASGVDGRNHAYYGFLPEQIYFENKKQKISVDAYIAVADTEITFGGCDGIAHPSAIA